MSRTDIAILLGAQLIVTLLAVAIFFALRKRDTLRGPGAGRPSGDDSGTRTRFLATVSHEIRTPLNGVMGLAQLLDMTRLDPEQASYVEGITKSSRALAQLIDDILDFSQIEAGKLALREESFELAPLVEGVVELLAPRAMAKGLEMASLIAPDASPRLIGDSARLRQVLINLVGNAVNYTQRGGVGLRVFVEGSALRFDVCDSGPGVPPAARELIFEEFERAEASLTGRQGGAGLGLAISRRLVGLMGGKLLLSDTSGDGSTFSILLPLEKGEAPTVAKPLGGRHVLIVSESRFEAPFLAESLRYAGAEATCMSHGRAGEALAQREVSAYDAIMLDCALGPQAIPALIESARAGGAGRLLLLFSPLERRAYGEASLRDVDGWLVKPVRRASLLARLSQAPPGAAASMVADEPFPLFRGLKLLVAEDDDVNALILTRALGKLGAEVSRARDGGEAVTLSTEGLGPGAAPFDAILMDLFLPELNGRDATRRIRAAESDLDAPRTPILVLTASVLEEDSRAARAAGADVILTKPIDLPALAATLDELRVARVDRTAAAPRADRSD